MLSCIFVTLALDCLHWPTICPESHIPLPELAMPNWELGVEDVGRGLCASVGGRAALLPVCFPVSFHIGGSKKS